jgi:flagellar motor switch protein FliN/FliY
MLLKRHDVKVIVDMLMGMETPEEEFELNELNISAICEVMNQMMGSSATALSEFLSKTVNISTPESFEIDDVIDFKEKYYKDENVMVVVGFTLKIADQLESEFINVMAPGLAKELVAGFLPEGGQEPEQTEPNTPAPAPEESTASSGGILSQEEIEKLLAGSSEPEAAAQPTAEPTPKPVQAKTEASGGTLSQEEIEKLLAGSADAPAPQPEKPVTPQPVMENPMPGTDAMSMQQMMSQMQMQQQMMSQMQQMILQLQNEKKNTKEEPVHEPKTIQVKPIPQKNLQEGEVSYEEQEENRELIMGVPLEVSVEIGRTRKLVKEILEFTKGSLVILDKLAGEQVDLYVNGQCIAKGDVVVVDDNFGIRITEIIKKNVE